MCSYTGALNPQKWTDELTKFINPKHKTAASDIAHIAIQKTLEAFGEMVEVRAAALAASGQP